MIEVTSLSKTFNWGSPNQILALRSIALKLDEGEFVTIIGSNGAGKSTLLNMIAGVFPPDAGRVKIFDRDVTNWAEHQRAKLIGRVFQDPLRGTAATMTIEQNLAMAVLRGQRRGLSLGVNNKLRSQFKEELSQLNLGLENRLGSKVGLLSGGQRQALTLLMATINKPRVLLLDEHTAALDPGAAELISNLTAKIIREHSLTALMVTHNMQQALSMGTRTFMMHQGQIIFDVRGEERARLTVSDLIARFSKIMDDKALLSKL